MRIFSPEYFPWFIGQLGTGYLTNRVGRVQIPLGLQRTSVWVVFITRISLGDARTMPFSTIDIYYSFKSLFTEIHLRLINFPNASQTEIPQKRLQPSRYNYSSVA